MQCESIRSTPIFRNDHFTQTCLSNQRHPRIVSLPLLNELARKGNIKNVLFAYSIWIHHASIGTNFGTTSQPLPQPGRNAKEASNNETRQQVLAVPITPIRVPLKTVRFELAATHPPGGKGREVRKCVLCLPKIDLIERRHASVNINNTKETDFIKRFSQTCYRSASDDGVPEWSSPPLRSLSH